MRSRRWWLVSVLLFLAAPEASAQIKTERVVDGLSRPLALVPDPRDASVLFVVEQGGLVRVLRNGQLLSAPFLDLRAAVSSDGERGLLGMAFEPPEPELPLPADGAVPRAGAASAPLPESDAPVRPAVPRLAPIAASPRNDRVFVNFTNREGHTVIARFRRSLDTPLVADAGSRRDVVWPDGRAFVEQPFANHNGGHLVFGPDGYLYVGLGDGGSAGDPMHRAQDPGSLLGKILRLDVRVAEDDARGYRVPPDNPFVDGTPIGALHEIWSFGLRNPWRYQFDDPARGGTGGLFIADVGERAREEIDYQPPGLGGLNYGWRLREGTLSFDERRPSAYTPLTPPIHEYGRSEGQSITGGFVYRGRLLDPGFVGRYFYADFVSGRVFSLATTGSAAAVQASDIREHTIALGGRAVLGMISSFAVDTAGELYMLNHSAGAVLRIVPETRLVPSAPRDLRLDQGRDGVTLEWGPAGTGVRPTHYVIETTDAGSTRALRRIPSHERSSVHLRLERPEACIRVRAVAADGAGPPTPPVCLPLSR